MKSAIAALILCLIATPPAMASLRVVSLNLCTDQLLVLLGPEDVVGLSPLARDPAISAVAAQAAEMPVVPAAAEAIFRRHPDLVLAETTGQQLLLGVLRRLGLHVVTISDPRTFPAIKAAITELSRLLGVPARGAALNSGIEAILAALPKPAQHPTAIVWEPRGLTPGPDSLAGAVLAAAGYHDAARASVLGLEALLNHPPDLLVVPVAPGMPSLATRMLQNPVLASISRRPVPASWLLCGSPFTARAAERIAR